MHTAVKLRTTVQPGHRVEFTALELPEGAEVEVSVKLQDEPEKQSVRTRFDALTSLWQLETAPLSSISQKAMHPAYQQIIGLGPEVVPYILTELQVHPGHWFWALRAITGENPIKAEQQGRVPEMAAAWVQWGRDHRVIE